MQLSLRVHPAGFLWIAALFLWGESNGALAALLALCLHEGAHLLLMGLCGVKACRIELTPFGGVADVQGFERLSSGKQCLIAAAGVMGSGLAALICFRLIPSGLFWQRLFKANLCLALLNVIPVFPLDGARVLLVLLGRLGLERQARRALLWLAYGFCAFLLMLGIYGAWIGQIHLALFFFPPYLAYAAHESALCGTIREMDGIRQQKTEMRPGEAKEVQAYACYGEPDGLLLSRLWKGMSNRRNYVLYVLNRQDGSLEKTLWEAELARKLFDESLDHLE